MKAVALFLALAVITGCNARSLPFPTSQQWGDLSLTDLLTFESTLYYDYELWDGNETTPTPYTEPPTGQLSEDLQLLADRLQRDMLKAKERSIDYLGELKTIMEHNSNHAQTRINAFATKLKKHLNMETEEILNTVATYLGELQSRISQNQDAVKGHVHSYIHDASDTATKKLTDVSSMLQSQGKTLGQQLEIQAEGLKTQAEGLKTLLDATAQELRTSLEGKIDELRELFSPYATRIREQFENKMDKVKEPDAA